MVFHPPYGSCLHPVGFVQVLAPRAFGRWELAAAIAAEAAIAVFRSVELGQKLTSFAIDKPGRALALEDSWRLEKHQAPVVLQDDLKVAPKNARPHPGD